MLLSVVWLLGLSVLVGSLLGLLAPLGVVPVVRVCRARGAALAVSPRPLIAAPRGASQHNKRGHTLLLLLLLLGMRHLGHLRLCHGAGGADARDVEPVGGRGRKVRVAKGGCPGQRCIHAPADGGVVGNRSRR